MQRARFDNTKRALLYLWRRSAGLETRRRAADTLLTRRIAGVSLRLAFRLVGQETRYTLVLFGFADGGFFSRFRFGFEPCCLRGSLTRCLFGGFQRQALLLQPSLFGFANSARFEDRLAFRLAGQHCRIVCCRSCLEALQKRFLCLVCGVAPLENVFFPVDSQVQFPEVYVRRLHTRAKAEFKRQNGMPAMNRTRMLQRNDTFGAFGGAKMAS